MYEYRPHAASSFAEAVQSPYRAAANIARIVRERNTNYLLTLAELTGDMLQEPAPETLCRNAKSLADERVKQREAFGAVAAEMTNAYLDALYAPFYLLRGD